MAFYSKADGLKPCLHSSELSKIDKTFGVERSNSLKITLGRMLSKRVDQPFDISETLCVAIKSKQASTGRRYSLEAFGDLESLLNDDEAEGVDLNFLKPPTLEKTEDIDLDITDSVEAW